MKKLQAPFPYFGGKSKVTTQVWDALGSVGHYLEPFFGSGAVLLNRPHKPKVETINDKDGFVANAWRGIKYAPDEVAAHCDWPVNHADLPARRKHLMKNEQELLSKLIADHKYFDAELAGYWIWGMGCWIGAGFTTSAIDDKKIGNRPHIANGGTGVHKAGVTDIYKWFDALSERLRRVRVVCGDWTKLCGGNWQDNKGTCGMFFDPPYGVTDRADCYHCDDTTTVAAAVNAWCLRRGELDTHRLVLAGYYSEHENLLQHGWTVKKWKATGGYSVKGSRGEENAEREALFFSPYCIPLWR